MNRPPKRSVLLCAGVILVALWITYILFLRHQVTLANVQYYAHAIQAYAHAHQVLAIVMFSLLFISATLAWLPITALLSVSAGFIFGPFLGTLLVVMCVVTGAIILFSFTRYVLRATLERRYHARITRYQKRIATDGIWYLLMMQLVPFTPMFLVTTAAALSRMSGVTFALVTGIGVIPGTLIYTLVGNRLITAKNLEEIVPRSGAIVLLCAVIVLFVVHAVVRSWQSATRN